jgi:hypothetical protein
MFIFVKLASILTAACIEFYICDPTNVFPNFLSNFCAIRRRHERA